MGGDHYDWASQLSGAFSPASARDATRTPGPYSRDCAIAPQSQRPARLSSGPPAAGQRLCANVSDGDQDQSASRGVWAVVGGRRGWPFAEVQIAGVGPIKRAMPKRWLRVHMLSDELDARVLGGAA